MVLNVLGLAVPLAVLQIFGRVIPFSATETLTIMLIGLLVIAVLEFILREARSRLLGRQAAAISHDLSKELVARQLFADPLQEGSISRRRRLVQMQAGTVVADSFAGIGRLHAIEIPFALLAIGGIALIAGPLVWVPVSGLGILAVAALAMRQRQTHALEDRVEADDARYDFWGDVLGNISGVKAAQMETGLRAKYQSYQQKSSRAGMAAIRAANLFENFSTVAGYSFASATILAGALLVIDGRLGPAELAACTMLSTRAVQPSLQLIRHWASGASVKAPLQAARSGLATPVIRHSNTSESPRLEGNIVFEEVTTRATKTGRATLRGQSFHIPPNRFTKLESSGRAAPEAAIGLLLGEIVPENGQVALDGDDPRNLMDCRGTGGLVYVAHTPVILNASIIENIAGVIDAGNIKRAYDAADLVGITDFVNTLPYGFDTHMRETGMHDSSLGFLQMISVARAVAQNPAILLLSDCCSSLDQTMQARVVAALAELSGDVSILAYDSAGIFDSIAQDTIELSTPRLTRRQHTATLSKSSADRTGLTEATNAPSNGLAA
ncbi:ABC transporter transmembrane domain-containing protein [Actibacterium sp. 188UL27-1]|uniref:ABC transporter transmembrane domain-containing protein n=1 Tax=Actibacterium sp. 188UL27-1 TaxID=2786961 RepID=UPI0019569973|nr:ABC transporter transmembrane domain-containing protein [Actibacterium sp. 188UL27-1]